MKEPIRRLGKRHLNEAAVVLHAFSVDHASRITGLSKARLTRWDQLGFFSPERAEDDDRGNPYSRMYSFTDLVGLRTLAVLTDVHKLSLRTLREAYPKLAKRVERPWSDMPLSVLKRRIVFDLDGQPIDTEGQLAGNHISLPTIASEVSKAAQAMRGRKKDDIGVFEKSKFVAHNSLVFAGTRIPVRAVRSFIDDGYSDVEIVAEYPSLTKFDVSVVRSMKDAA